MEGFSRDLLCGFGKGDAPPPEQTPGQLPEETDELELSLGLSLGGRFGVDKLPRSSSVAGLVTTTPVEVPAPSAGVQFYSPSAASSEGDGQRSQGTVARTSSLHTLIEASGNEECKKRKEAHSLKRLVEVTKKRLEGNSLACGASKQAAGLCDEADVGTDENRSRGKHLAKGLPPKYSATIKKPSSAFKDVTKEQGSSSSIPSFGEAMSSPMAALLSLTPIPAATLGSTGDGSILGSAAETASANSMVDMERRRLMQEMPSVYTKELPNGKRVEGFLYKHRRADDLTIVCICHGMFLTPKEFVEHAGDGMVVDNPLRHIIVVPTP